MSAPNTNIDKQKRRHRGPLIGMALVVIFGVVMIMIWLGEEAAQSDPAPPPPQTTGSIDTGAAPAMPETTAPEATGPATTVPETTVPDAAPVAPAP